MPFAFLVFATLIWWVTPNVSVRDAGEFSTAAFHLGVAHETGFPLYLLLGKLACLLPLGEISFRVGLLSLGTTMAGAYFLGRVLQRVLSDVATAQVLSAWLAVVVPTSALIFRWAIAPEVYGITLLAGALVLSLTTSAFDGNEAAGRRLGLLLGLVLGLHAELRLLVGLPAVLIALVALRRGRKWPRLLGIAGAIGVAQLAAIPLRAATAPFVNWSDPHTLLGLMQHLAGTRIRAAFTEEMLRFDVEFVIAAARTLSTQVFDSTGVVIRVLAPVGLVLGIQRPATRGLALWALCWIVVDLGYGLFLNPMGLRDWQVGQFATLGAILLCGLAMARFGDRFGRMAPLVVALVGLVAATEPMLSRPDLKAIPTPALDHMLTAALDQEPRALLLVTSDDLAGGLLYAQGVLGRRPDVTVLVRQHLFDASDVRARLARGGNEVRRFGDKFTDLERIRRQNELAERTLRHELGRRRVLWEPAQDPPPAGQLFPAYPLFVLESPPANFDSPRLQTIADEVEKAFFGVADPLTRTLPANQLSQLGRLALQLRDPVAAHALFLAALRWVPGDAATATNVAVMEAIRGDYDLAARHVEAVLQNDPSRFVARMNAGKYRLQLGQRAIAQAHFAAAGRLRPTDPAPDVWLARIAITEKKRDRALVHIEAAMHHNPIDIEVNRVQAEFREVWPLPKTK